jgi:hypothetical protein
VHQGFQTRLKDGDFTALQASNLFAVRIDANDRVTDICKAGPGHQSNVSGADD